MKIVEVKIKVSDESYQEFLSYLKSLPVDVILFGLRFAYKRYAADTLIFTSTIFIVLF